MQICRHWGRDLSWWRDLSGDDRVLYIAEWNLTQQEARKKNAPKAPIRQR